MTEINMDTNKHGVCDKCGRTDEEIMELVRRVENLERLAKSYKEGNEHWAGDCACKT